MRQGALRMGQHYTRRVAKCDLCGATSPDAEIGDHLLREHPEVGGFECWPDGGPVVIDETVETPADLE